MGPDDCDVVTTPPELAIEEARLESGSICIRYSYEIAEDCDPQRTARALGQRGERREVFPRTIHDIVREAQGGSFIGVVHRLAYGFGRSREDSRRYGVLVAA